jgi:hypothetical protein
MPVRPARSAIEVSSCVTQKAFLNDHIFEQLHPFIARPALRVAWILSDATSGRP